ncbi:MAG: DUF1223 domain-containing protein, partial [Pseudomonadota bacterium]
CPPADKALGRYIRDNPDAVALEFHVDYWDQLVYGRHGVWKDPFSDRRYSTRQRRYAGADLDGRTGVYTPQAVIGGVRAELGSAGGKILKAVHRIETPLTVSVRREGEGYIASITGAHAGNADVWLAGFERLVDTKIDSGENHDKVMRNHNIVRSLDRAGRWRGETLEVALDGAVSNDTVGCAVFVQAPRQGAVLGAAYCP